MHREVKLYEWGFDWCSKRVQVTDPNNRAPEDWTRVDDYGYGLTNYTKTLLLCPYCLVEFRMQRREKSSNA